MKSFIRTSNMKTQRGVTLIMVTIALVALIGFAALAIDVSNLYVARNELQNAADAGALAGARSLYPDDNNKIKIVVAADADEIAVGAATANRSQGVPVEVSPDEDITMVYWNFKSRQSTVLDRTTQVNLWSFDPSKTSFINAISVTTKREATPVNTFFSRILDSLLNRSFTSFSLTSHAVAFIGTLGPGEVNLPIAVCRSTVIDIEVGNCGVGRRIPNNTGGWTNFTQPSTPVSVDSIPPLLADLCTHAENPNPILLGDPVGVTENIGDLTDLVECWKNAVNAVDTDNDGIPDQSDRPWRVTLPVIDCPIDATEQPHVPDSPTVLGAARIEILWMTPANSQPLWKMYSQAPRKMDDWDCTEPDKCTVNTACSDVCSDVCSACSESEECIACNFGCKRWCNFVDYFTLKEIDEHGANKDPAHFAPNSIYVRPKSCIIFGKPVLVE